MLKRQLETKLLASGIRMTSTEALELLRPCKLNRFEKYELLKSVYSITKPDAEQQRVLAALDMTQLADDQQLGAQLGAKTI